MAIGYEIESLSRSGFAGGVTVNTVEPHPFKIGDKIRLYNVMGGGTAYPFMAGNPYTITSMFVMGDGKTSKRFGYTQAGALSSDEMLTSIAITSGAQYQNSTQFVQIVTSAPHNLSTRSRIRLKGVTHPALSSGSPTLDAINAHYSPEDMQVVNSTTLILRIRRPLQNWSPEGQPFNWSAATLEWVPTGAVVALDDGINATQNGSIGGIGINSAAGLAGIRFWRLRSEAQIIQGLVGLAGQSKGIDYPFLRLFDPTDYSRLTRSPLRARINIQTAPTTLRSALDSIIEVYQGVDAKKRRYFVNPDGQLVYELTADTQPPSATAPYKIITTEAGTPNLTTGAATVAPYSLTVDWDHDTTKRALFETTNRAGAPIIDLIKSDSPDALGTAFKRLGAPYFDEALDYPTGTGDSLIARQNAARSFFNERYAPILSGSFTLRGGGTASYNQLGFSAGYAAVTVPGSATFQPGDEILAPASKDLNSGTVTFTLFPFKPNMLAGMPITVRGITDGGLSTNASGTVYNGNYTITSVGTTGYTFDYELNPGGVRGARGFNLTGDAAVTIAPVFIRTGTAPNQIVTVTSPIQHGINNNATIVVSGLGGVAGTSMNGTATATVVSDYVYTYPSTGSNGTATGTATVTATTLVPRWEPGQWVDIAAAELGLTGLYRVEAVDWTLEPGSFQQAITITFNRRPNKTLTKLLREAS